MKIVGILIIAVVVVAAAAIWVFASSASLESGLVGYWDFNEGSGTMLGDSSDYDNDGTIYGDAAWVDGIDGTALYLDGINDYIDVGNDDSLNPTDTISISCWVKPESYLGYGWEPLVTKGYTSHVDPYYQYHLGMTGDLRLSSRPGSFSFLVSVNGARHSVFTGDNIWIPGNWYHVVGTFGGSKLSIYVNGDIKNTVVVTGLSMMDYGQDVYFGRFNNLIGGTEGTGDIDAYTPGTIDEIRIYDRALSAQNVEDLYLLSL